MAMISWVYAEIWIKIIVNIFCSVHIELLRLGFKARKEPVFLVDKATLFKESLELSERLVIFKIEAKSEAGVNFCQAYFSHNI